MPYWVDNSDNLVELRNVCGKIARKKCWFFSNFNGDNTTKERPRYILFRYKKHAEEFMNIWAEIHQEQYNLRFTGYKEGSEEGMKIALEDRWKSLYQISFRQKSDWNPRSEHSICMMNNWLKENNISDYFLDVKTKIWYFKNNGDLIQFKLVWG